MLGKIIYVVSYALLVAFFGILLMEIDQAPSSVPHGYTECLERTNYNPICDDLLGD